MKRLLLFLLIGMLILSMATGCQLIERLLGGNGDPNGEDPNGEDPAGPETVLAAIVDGNVIFQDDEGTWTSVTDTGGFIWMGWSPDGSKLALIRNTLGTNPQLWVINHDGSELSLVTGGVYLSDARGVHEYLNTPGSLWHPDSNQLACVLQGTNSVHVFNLSAGTSYSIDFGHPDIEGPWWSSSGKMAVMVWREVDDPASLRDEWWEEEYDYSEFYFRWHLVVVNAAGVEIFEHPSTAKMIWAGDHLFYTGYSKSFMMGMSYQDGVFALPSGTSAPINVERWGGMAIGVMGNSLVAHSTARDIMVYNFANRSLAGPVYTQDYFITYSEFEYPFLFTPAYHANQLAILALTLESEEDAFDQFGYWDLDIYNWDNGSSWTAWPEVFVLDGNPGPLQWTISFFWSYDGQHLYVFQEDGSLWQVASDGSGSPSMLLPACEFVASRPLN